MTHLDLPRNAAGSQSGQTGISTEREATRPPTDPKTGVPIPLTSLLAPQGLKEHRAMVGFELEVLSRKLDRFGWDRMDQRVKMRLMQDWIAALQDYPLDEIQSAITAILGRGDKSPNEHQVKAEILKARGIVAREFQRQNPTQEPERERPSKEKAAAILRAAGYSPRVFSEGAA